MYPYTLCRWGNVFILLRGELSQINVKTDEDEFLTARPVLTIVSEDEYLCYITDYPKSPRILRKVSAGSASNSSVDSTFKSIFLSVFAPAPSPDIAGG